ncbi:phage regulatory CII family protein [Marichromatium sp. AB31]|uniref:phage regulatory CII family protein n=1 Tax=Marichromatium sp. AB31 TaxID=2483362 RepID=UPI000F40C233|nr:phage regulatory CII family protein [Marichromatium sp. AB31]RNE89856.1 hypothetical protein EBL84_09210 [Marichromatium sp. AB31]
MCSSEALNRAIYDTAHDFPGGVPAMARLMAANPGTLFNKVSTTHEGHRLNVYEALAMQLLSGDLRILYAMAAELGQGCYTLGDFSDCSDADLLDRITTLGAARGAVDHEIHQAFEDRKITRAEAGQIRQRVEAAVRANLELLSRLDALAEAETQAEERRALRAVGGA